MFRPTFGKRLLIGALTMATVLVLVTGGFLLASRHQQIVAESQSEADHRAAEVAAYFTSTVTPLEQNIANSVIDAMRHSLAAPVGIPDLAAVAAASLPHSDGNDLQRVYVVVGAGENAPVVANTGDTPLSAALHAGTGTEAQDVRGLAALKRHAALQYGVAFLLPTLPVWLVSVEPTDSSLTGLGLRVIVVSPLAQQLQNARELVSFPVVFLGPDLAAFRLDGSAQPDPVRALTPPLVRLSAVLDTQAAALFRSAAFPPSCLSAPAQPEPLCELHDAYTVRENSAGEVQASLHPIPSVFSAGVPPAAPAASASASASPGSVAAVQQPGALVGVEIPTAPYLANEASDRIQVALVMLTALVIMTFLVLVFVDQFVRRPVARLERGVARIAAGDYSQDVRVTSDDELGSLARSVNSMREQIAGHVRHVNTSVLQLGEVSRALTTTAGGVQQLVEAVVVAARAIAGDRSTATLMRTEAGGLVDLQPHGQVDVQPLLGDPVALQTLGKGRSVRLSSQSGHLLAVPMFYQEHVVGALLVATADHPVAETDERALSALTNNAAVAMENTRLFEQEHDTVQRLTDLDLMRSNFLATVQHELRTPVTAIRGHIELITLAWSRFDEATKLDVIRDIEVASMHLGDIIETILDFSLLGAHTMVLHPVAVAVRPEIEAAIEAITAQHKSGLRTDVSVQIPDSLQVQADQHRFRQVVRALLDNAVKFAPDGGRVMVRGADSQDGTHVELRVVDDGIGIAREQREHVFEPFFQADNSQTRGFGGMGLGLALARRICAAHGATVEVGESAGAGTTMVVRWPRPGASQANAPLAGPPEPRDFHVPEA